MANGTKLTPNYWFSKLSTFVTFVAIAAMTLITYIHFSDETSPYRDEVFNIYLYLSYGMGALLLLLAGSAWYLRLQLKFLPLSVSFILIICYCLIAVMNQINIEPLWQPAALFIQLLLSLMLISGLWWLSVLTPPQQFPLIYYNNKHYRIFAWVGLVLIYLEIALEFWVRSHYALFCHGPVLCDWQLFTDLDIQSVINFWKFGQLETADLATQFRMFYHTLMFIILSYFSLLSLVLLFSTHLSRIGVINFFLIVIKIAISFSNSEWLIKMVDYAMLILLLLNTIAFISDLYPKLQSTGWAYQPMK